VSIPADCFAVEGANDLDAAAAKLMCLPRVQKGHLAYWYTPSSCGWAAYAGPCLAKTDLETWVYEWGPQGSEVGDTGLREIPRYSQDMKAAWEVVEYLRELGVWFNLYDMRDGTWRASFCRAGAPKPSIDRVHESAATAICLAAVAVNESMPRDV